MKLPKNVPAPSKPPRVRHIASSSAPKNRRGEPMSDFLPDLEPIDEPSILLRLLNQAGARRVLSAPSTDLGIAETRPFPFLAMVGQHEMRIALMLAVINPAIGGVLLIGPR